MYLVGFAVSFLLMRRLLRNSSLKNQANDMHTLFFWMVVGLLLGGRLVAVTVYNTTGEYLRQPWRIFWPFANGRYVGLQGISYHGSLIGIILAGWIYLKVTKKSLFDWGDMLPAAGTLGYTFGRLGNFINAELYGRATAAPWGMLFDSANRLPTDEPWVREIAEKTGISTASDMINLPRHPSQLYEAFFEGVVLWAILWFIVYPRRPFKGAVFAAYLIGYGAIRFIIEYFRQPDAGLGYVIRLSDRPNPLELFVSPFNFTTGQVFCLLMIIAGVICWVAFRKRALNIAQAEARPISRSSKRSSANAGRGGANRSDGRSKSRKKR